MFDVKYRCIKGMHKDKTASLKPMTKAEMLMSPNSIHELIREYLLNAVITDDEGFLIEWEDEKKGWIPASIKDEYFAIDCSNLKDTMSLKEGLGVAVPITIPAPPKKNIVMDVGFSVVLDYLNRGMRAYRKDWVNQYIKMVWNISYSDKDMVQIEATDKSSFGILIVDEKGVAKGWFSSMTDILSDDWSVCE